jgi:hypothetical protein
MRFKVLSRLRVDVAQRHDQDVLAVLLEMELHADDGERLQLDRSGDHRSAKAELSHFPLPLVTASKWGQERLDGLEL